MKITSALLIASCLAMASFAKAESNIAGCDVVTKGHRKALTCLPDEAHVRIKFLGSVENMRRLLFGEAADQATLGSECGAGELVGAVYDGVKPFPVCLKLDNEAIKARSAGLMIEDLEVKPLENGEMSQGEGADVCKVDFGIDKYEIKALRSGRLPPWSCPEL